MPIGAKMACFYSIRKKIPMEVILPLTSTPFVDVGPDGCTVENVGGVTSNIELGQDPERFARFIDEMHLVVKPKDTIEKHFTFSGDLLLHGWVRTRSSVEYSWRTIVSMGDFTNGILLRLTPGDSLFFGGDTVGQISLSWFPVEKWTYFAIMRKTGLVSFHTFTKTVDTVPILRLSKVIRGTVNSSNSDLLIGKSLHSDREYWSGDMFNIELKSETPTDVSSAPFK